MPLTKDLISKMQATMGSEKAEELIKITERILNAAKDCQLTDSKGVLDGYGELSYLSMILVHPKHPPTLETTRVIRDMFTSVENEVLSIFSEICSCRIK